MTNHRSIFFEKNWLWFCFCNLFSRFACSALFQPLRLLAVPLANVVAQLLLSNEFFTAFCFSSIPDRVLRIHPLQAQELLQASVFPQCRLVPMASKYVWRSATVSFPSLSMSRTDISPLMTQPGGCVPVVLSSAEDNSTG